MTRLIFRQFGHSGEISVTNLYKLLKKSVNSFKCWTKLCEVGCRLITPMSQLILIGVCKTGHQLT